MYTHTHTYALMYTHMMYTQHIQYIDDKFCYLAYGSKVHGHRQMWTRILAVYADVEKSLSRHKIKCNAILYLCPSFGLKSTTILWSREVAVNQGIRTVLNDNGIRIKGR